MQPLAPLFVTVAENRPSIFVRIADFNFSIIIERIFFEKCLENG